jgi:hypothetical protein
MSAFFVEDLSLGTNRFDLETLTLVFVLFIENVNPPNYICEWYVLGV